MSICIILWSPMKRIWRTINRPLIPSYQTAIATGILIGVFLTADAWTLMRPGVPLHVAQWLWAAVMSLIAVASLVSGITGYLTRRRRRRYDDRRVAGLCGRCGYDLRAALSVRCPECGAYHGTALGAHLRRAA